MRIHPGLSVFLDVVRFLLAALVVIGHWTHAFPYDWPDLLRAASAAVGAFFVLSGFTIYSITREVRPEQAPAFAVERLTRLWSVALPALLATLLLDSLARAIAPDYYAGCCSATADQPVLRLLVNALFLGELWGWGLSPLSNSPFWSLCYEAMFYVLFAVWLHGRGLSVRSLLMGAALIVVFGPTLLPYLGLWLLGVALAWLYLKATRVVLLALFAATLAVNVLGLLAHGLWMWLYKIALACQWIENSIKGLYPPDTPGMVWLSASLVGGALVFSAGLVLVMAWMPKPATAVSADRARRGLSFSRWLGEATFPLYLLHYPVLTALSAYVFAVGSGPTLSLQAGVALAVFALAFAAVIPCEKLKLRLRTVFGAAGIGRNAA